MTVGELKRHVEQLLSDNGCEDTAFDTICLLEDIGKVGRGRVLLSQNAELAHDVTEMVITAAKRRANGEPLQYILGEWEFLTLSLTVGDGVLIPRPETELLCETVADRIKKLSKTVKVVDLCAGSGCVGLGIASLVYPKKPQITAVELSDKAFTYLQQNVNRYPQYAVNTVKGDILTDFSCFDAQVDVIVSNPPYIKTADLSSLQREVQHEPRMALDGDEDGYRFYRAIAQHWLPKLTSDGFVAVEVGIGQAQTVAELFKSVDFCNTLSIRDAFGIDRVVVAGR